jgi:hypothetical protein
MFGLISQNLLSYLALRESFIGFVHDYLQYGPTIASIHDPLLRFFFLTFRYSIPLTEISILSWEWYAPVELETEPAAIAIATPVAIRTIEAIAEPEPINVDPLAFDPETGILSFRGKTCEIPFKTYQHALCAKLFERAGVRVDEKDIMRAIDWEMDKADSDRLVKDAVYAVNRKAEIELGIEKILVWKKFTAWVNDEYASDFLGG